MTLSGHRGAVTALAFNKDGTLLASGSRDTDLIVWDVVGEAGLYRLKGHKDQITCIAFLNRPRDQQDKSSGHISSNQAAGYLLSASKDTLLKLWDLSSQFCRETVVGHRTEVWSFGVDASQSIVLSGGSEPMLKAWKINWDILDSPLEENSGMDVDAAAKAITLYGNIPRRSRERVVTIRFHSSDKFIGVHSLDKSVELYVRRDHEYIRKKIQRRRKRAKEKGKEIEISDEIQAEDEFSSYTVVYASSKVRGFDFAPTKNLEKTGHLQARFIIIFTCDFTIERETEIFCRRWYYH